MSKIHNLKTVIQDYILLDDDIKTKEHSLKLLKNERIKKETIIVDAIKENKIEGKDIKIGNNKFRYEESEVKSNLTQNNLKESLVAYFLEHYGDKLSKSKCEEKAKEIFQYIVNHRKEKTKCNLKRIILD
jgi:hypothetical protein